MLSFSDGAICLSEINDGMSLWQRSRALHFRVTGIPVGLLTQRIDDDAEYGRYSPLWVV